MTNVPGLFTVISSAGPPFTARPVTLHRYEVQASSGKRGTVVVSSTANSWTGELGFAVLMMRTTYVHGPGGSVIAGLLHTSRGVRVNSTSVERAGVMSLTQGRMCSVSMRWAATFPLRSSTCARKNTVLLDGN